MSQTAVFDPLGILESAAVPERAQIHFDVGDGWIIIMTGEELRRPKSLQRVAITRCEITLESEEQLKVFVELIKNSDATLSKVPDSEVMYDWQIVRRKGLIVRFGVTWYDPEFYKKRKDVYLSLQHQGIFKQFGATPQSIRIEHVPL